MAVIYKYPIKLGPNILELPKGAKILSAEMDCDNNYCIWAMVNPNNRKEQRVIHLIGTGWDINPNFTFISTFVSKEEGLVWHCFEENTDFND